MTTSWKQRYAQRTQRMGGSTIRELLKLTEQPEVISFAGGLPAPEVFPVDRFREAARRVLAREGSRALQYGTTEGYGPLREMIVQRMSRYGIPASVDNILITSGSQQALDLIGKLLINPGDLILTEAPTYLGALQAWRAYQAEFVTTPIDDDGICCFEELEEALCAGPKFMYILPNFQNPAGVTLSEARRRHLIAVADHYGIPIVEDDPYGQLRYEGEHIKPLLVFDAEHVQRQRHEVQASSQGEIHGDGRSYFHTGNVIYLSTFSKTLAPGLRLGWLAAPADVVRQCVIAKQGMDLHTSTFVQMVAYEVARDGFLDEHVRTIRDVYRRRRDLMLSMLKQSFPPEAHWTRPAGGLFLWVTLPEAVDATDLLQKALAANVAFVPGSAFYPDGNQGSSSFRLNFSNATEEMIEVGIRRLGTVVAAALEREEREPVFA
ncbi:MAG: PLP-dependent aminotransferase family protein [Candidatus Promineifilaceae bacterium]|nr:PLP-dependent aminotransferase family protein [Candidatus Promineifilaceae bacterium]